jgi:hypothetical protein
MWRGRNTCPAKLRHGAAIDGAAKQFLFDGIRTKERGRRANLVSRRDIWSTGDAALAEAALASEVWIGCRPRGTGKAPR